MSKWIELPCEPHDSLEWSPEIAAAQRAVENGGKIVWKIAAGLERPFYPLDDELRFKAVSLALQQFSKEIWPRFQEATEAVCLYRGTADFQAFFSWTHVQQTNYKAWLEEEQIEDSLLSKRLFTAEAFAIYFQMLSHRLPDEVEVQLLFDLESFSSQAEALQVISKDRFEHFQLAIRGMDIPLDGLWWEGTAVSKRDISATTGIVFPENRQNFSNKSFDSLLKADGSVKILFESFLSEDWEGIDRLLVVKGSLSLQGERKLKGFSAAGGEVTYIE